MPGVQERFNGLTTVINSVEASINSRMGTKFERVDSSIDEIRASVNHLKEIAQLQMTALHAAMSAITKSQIYENHILGTNSLRTAHDELTQQPGSVIRTPPTDTTIHDHHELTQQRGTMNRTPPDTTRDEQQHMSNTQPNPPLPPLLVPPPRLSQRFASLSLMWDEWHGTGGDTTRDKPIPGGFAKLEELHKSKWRKHLDGAQGRHCTRIRLIIEGIKKRADMLRITAEQSQDELELEWIKGKKSPDALIRYLQDQGYIKKTKPRGKISRTAHDNNEMQ